MKDIFISSPLQSFTDFRFRNAHQKYFGGIDTYYAPYIRLNGKFEIKPIYHRDLIQKNNHVNDLIPQIMTNSKEEFLFVADYVQKLGYSELNWNLGCPYPMVVNRCMGSGLINDPDRIDEILDAVHSNTDITVSMKMRLGYEVNTEIIDVLPILDKYPIKSIGIHARLGKQLYKGGVDLDGFEKCIDNTKHLIYYNGDIVSLDAFHQLKERFPTINHWMVGRGLIANPFLPLMLKNEIESLPSDYLETFKQFHDTLLDQHTAALSGDKHVIMKMSSYWEYFEELFPDSNREIKKIKKSKSLDVYSNHFSNFLEDF